MKTHKIMPNKTLMRMMKGRVIKLKVKTRSNLTVLMSKSQMQARTVPATWPTSLWTRMP